MVEIPESSWLALAYLRHSAAHLRDLESIVEIFKTDIQRILSLPPERDAYLNDGYAAFLAGFAQRLSKAPDLQSGPTSDASISYQVGTRTTMNTVSVAVVTAPINHVLIP
jgi:hypothetical protein